MNYKAFENLELIPQLLEKISILEIKLQHLEENLIIPLDLTNRKKVKTFLNISESTLNNMMKDGRLKQGKHYTKSIKLNRTKIIFIESAIKEFKENK